jgi:hypothetical protein
VGPSVLIFANDGRLSVVVRVTPLMLAVTALTLFG